LVAALREFLPNAQFLGIGGESLAAQGVKLLYHAEDLAVVGLSEVLGHLPVVFRALRDVAGVLKQERPALAILVDFPDFNFWVARLACWHGVPVMYYISPQVWAWRTYRVRTLARLADRIAVIFPFEAEFYQQWGVAAEYVGHPLMETLPEVPDRRALMREWGLDPERLTLALLPGSRASEVRLLLPIMLEAAKILKQAITEGQFVLPLASTVPIELIEEIIKEETENRKPKTENLKIIPGQSYQALAAAHLALVASGTATVEAALAGTPSIILYRLSPFTFAVGRCLIRVPHVAMANLLAGERMFPELLQHDCTPESVAWEALAWIREGDRVGKLRHSLTQVITRLGGPGASRRAAEVAVELIKEKASSKW
jgi:lipid-A-disaccharide synthase